MAERETQLFAVIGNQRTGTNILREILNSNESVAMLGEVVSPSPAPAHWHNFINGLPANDRMLLSAAPRELLLDRYFGFICYRVREHWADRAKQRSRAIGFDVKYNQLRQFEPPGQTKLARPLLLEYLRTHDGIVIHTTRNVLHCAISAQIAARRNLWHNYGGISIDRSYCIDIGECLDYARAIVNNRRTFLEHARGCNVVECRYEDLVLDMGCTADGTIRGPLREIADALGVPFRFRNDGRLQRAIDVPYSHLLSNYREFVAAVANSEFASLTGSFA